MYKMGGYYSHPCDGGWGWGWDHHRHDEWDHHHHRHRWDRSVRAAIPATNVKLGHKQMNIGSSDT